MKKFLYCLTAMTAMFFAASCQEELNPVKDGDTNVTFTVAAGDVATRADIADGTNVDILYWEIYKDLNESPLGEGSVPKTSDKTFVVDLKLLADQTYTIIFWAQVNGKDHYDVTDLRDVKIKYTEETIDGKTYKVVNANDESRAAFFRVYEFATENGKSINETIFLKRPFSQVNLGSTTYETSFNQVDGGKVKVKTSEMKVTHVATSFETVPGVGKGEEELIFKARPTPNGDRDATEKILDVNETKYYWLGMNYLIVCGDADNVTVDITLSTNYGDVNHSIGSVPVKENFRTNLLGNFLTTGAKFTVVVDERFDGEYYGPDFMKKPAYDDATKTYTVAEYYELVWFADQVNNQNNSFSGQTVKLATDIDLAGKTWTPIGASGAVFKGTFEGAVPVTKSEGETRNAVISNLKVAAEAKESAGLFANSRGLIKNLNVVDAEITGHYKTGVIVGDGLCSRVENCHVDNATILVTPYKENEANNVGGIVGYLSGEPTAYVKGCSVKNSNITAYRKVGGIVGAANRAAEVSGNLIESSVITADQTSAYNEDKPADAGAVVGWAASTAVVKDNEVAGGINTANANAVKVVIKAKDSAVDFSESEVTVLPSGEYNLEEDVKSAGLQVNNGNGVTINANSSTLELGSPNVYGFVAEGEGTTLVINDADVNSLGGGIGAGSGANVTVNNSTIAVNSSSTSGRYNIYAVDEGTVVTINSGTFSFSKTLNQKRAYIYCGAGATVYVKGGTFGKASTRSGYTAGILGDGDVIITGGTFGFDPTNWVAEGYAATKVGTEWHVAPATL